MPVSWSFTDANAVMDRARALLPSMKSDDWAALDEFIANRATEIRGVLERRGLSALESWQDDDEYSALWVLCADANAQGALAMLLGRFRSGTAASQDYRDAMAEYKRNLQDIRETSIPGVTSDAGGPALAAAYEDTTIYVTKDTEF